MPRRLAPTIGLLVGLVPAIAYGQTNIDQGKSPAQIFASDCATCHKATRGLAGGKSSSALAGFLREHYTASREQAAALAAYVLGAGGNAGSPTPVRGQKPVPEHGKPTVSDARPGNHPIRQSGKPEEPGGAATAKLQAPGDEEGKPETEPARIEEPIPTPTPRAGRTALGSGSGRNERGRGRPKEPEVSAAPREPATVVAQPSAPIVPSQQELPAATPSAMALPSESGEITSVPRDDIPD